MSSCGNCDCPDKTNCPKKGNSFGIIIVDTEKSFEDSFELYSAENDGKCKCKPGCACTTCNCGH